MVTTSAAIVKTPAARSGNCPPAAAVEIKLPNRTLSFPSGWDYLLSFVLPNVYFHATTAYDILRHNGVKLGKGDYLGAVGQG